MSNLRYTVGEKVVFLRVNFEQGGFRFGNLFLPWEDKLKSIETYRLTCAEHHKVANCHDPEGPKDCDGFIFTQEDGTRWHNQYPTASYGQLDDSANRVVRRSYENHDLDKMSRQEILQTFGLFTDVRTYLENLYRGVLELTQANKPDQAAQLREHLNDVVTMVELAGLSVRVTPHEISVLAEMGYVSVHLDEGAGAQAVA